MDYAGSADVARRQNLVRSVSPMGEAVEQPIETLHGMYHGLVGWVRSCSETYRVQALDRQAKAFSLRVKNPHAVARLLRRPKSTG